MILRCGSEHVAFRIGYLHSIIPRIYFGCFCISSLLILVLGTGKKRCNLGWAVCLISSDCCLAGCVYAFMFDECLASLLGVCFLSRVYIFLAYEVWGGVYLLAM